MKQKSMNYIQAEKIRSQRNIRLSQYQNIQEALLDPDFQVESPDEVILVLSKYGTLYELNLLAAYIWELLIEPKTIKNIAQFVAEMFDIDITTATNDASEIMNNFEDLGLLKSNDEEFNSKFKLRNG